MEVNSAVNIQCYLVTVTVPNLIGKVASDAEAALADTGLRSQLVGAAYDVVSSQNPGAGATVVKNTLVTITAPPRTGTVLL